MNITPPPQTHNLLYKSTGRAVFSLDSRRMSNRATTWVLSLWLPRSSDGIYERSFSTGDADGTTTFQTWTLLRCHDDRCIEPHDRWQVHRSRVELLSSAIIIIIIIYRARATTDDGRQSSSPQTTGGTNLPKDRLCVSFIRNVRVFFISLVAI